MLRGSAAADMASKRSSTPANISPPSPPNPNQNPSQHNQTDPEEQAPSTPHNNKNSKSKEQKQPKFKTLGEKFLYCQRLVEEERRAKNTVDLTKEREKGKEKGNENGEIGGKEKRDNEEGSVETQIDSPNKKRKYINSTKQTSTEEEQEEVMPLEMRQLVVEKEIRDKYTRKRLAFEREMELTKESREDSTKSGTGKKILYSTPDLQKLTTSLTNDLYTTTPSTIPHLLQSLHTLRNTIPKPQHALLSQQILLSINKKLLDGYWKASLMTSIDNYVSHIANTRPDIGKSGFWDDCSASVKRPEGRFCGLGGCKEKVMVLAMGICVLVAPWVVRDLGFVGWSGLYWEVTGEGEDGKEERELGCVDFVENGSFAAQWFQRCNGEISKAMLYSCFLDLGMV